MYSFIPLAFLASQALAVPFKRFVNESIVPEGKYTLTSTIIEYETLTSNGEEIVVPTNTFVTEDELTSTSTIYKYITYTKPEEVVTSATNTWVDGTSTITEYVTVTIPAEVVTSSVADVEAEVEVEAVVEESPVQTLTSTIIEYVTYTQDGDVITSPTNTHVEEQTVDLTTTSTITKITTITLGGDESAAENNAAETGDACAPVTVTVAGPTVTVTETETETETETVAPVATDAPVESVADDIISTTDLVSSVPVSASIASGNYSTVITSWDEVTSTGVSLPSEGAEEATIAL